MDDVLKMKIGNIIKAVRLYLGLGQVEMAQKLGVSQATISKFEKGTLAPDVATWFNTVKVAQIIDPSCFNTGYVEIQQKDLSLNSDPYVGAFKLPNRYAEYKNITVKKLLPLINLVHERLGETGLNDFLKSKKLRPEYLTILNNPINVNFAYDLIELVGVENYPQNSFARLFDKESQGTILGEYEREKSLSSFLNRFVYRQKKYGIDLKYSADEEENRYVLNLDTQDSFNEFIPREEKIKDFYLRYSLNFPYNLLNIKYSERPDCISETENQLVLNVS